MVPVREPKTYSVIIADDLTLVREGLAALCQKAAALPLRTAILVVDSASTDPTAGTTRPAGLPTGASWIPPGVSLPTGWSQDPATGEALPQGWSVDPTTGQPVHTAGTGTSPTGTTPTGTTTTGGSGVDPKQDIHKNADGSVSLGPDRGLTISPEKGKKGVFTLSDTDVKPDPAGHVGKLKVGTDNQLEVDCDVYATYATRLLRAAGWTTVGYMAIVPGEATGRDAHAVALAKRPAAGGKTDYVAISDWMLKEFQAADDDAARAPLLAHGLDIYSSKGEPAAWKAYYSPAGSGGAFDMKLTDPENNGLTPYKSKGSP